MRHFSGNNPVAGIGMADYHWRRDMNRRQSVAAPTDTEVLGMIITDMEADAKSLDGKPFTGKTVGDMFGKVCAAVSALAAIQKRQISEDMAELGEAEGGR